MHKELIIAIFFGSLLGLAVAFSVWMASNTLLSTSDQATNTGQQTPSPKPTNSKAEDFVINFENYSVVSESPVLIAGKTSPKALVIASTKNQDYLTSADEAGAFKFEIGVSGWLNQVTFFSVNSSGLIEEKKLAVIFSTLVSKNKMENSNNDNFHAYLGSVTDITDTSFQMKSDDGDIKQVTFSNTTTVVNIVSKIKEATTKDLAIGDYVIAMGVVGENDILNASRVLVTIQDKEIIVKAVFGTISEINKKILQINGYQLPIQVLLASDIFEADSQNVEKKKKLTFSNLKEEQLVLISGTQAENVLEVKSLFVID